MRTVAQRRSTFRVWGPSPGGESPDPGRADGRAVILNELGHTNVRQTIIPFERSGNRTRGLSPVNGSVPPRFVRIRPAGLQVMLDLPNAGLEPQCPDAGIQDSWSVPVTKGLRPRNRDMWFSKLGSACGMHRFEGSSSRNGRNDSSGRSVS